MSKGYLPGILLPIITVAVMVPVFLIGGSYLFEVIQDFLKASTLTPIITKAALALEQGSSTLIMRGATVTPSNMHLIQLNMKNQDSQATTSAGETFQIKQLDHIKKLPFS